MQALRSIRPYILLLACGLLGSAFAQSGPPRSFYIGHSLSDQIPDMLQSLSNDHPELQFDWVYQSIPGAPLRWQWDRQVPQDYTPIPPHYHGFYDAQHGLPSAGFDILVLTESVPRHAAILDETHHYAGLFVSYARQHRPDIRVLLNEPWHCLDSGTPTGCDFDVNSSTWRQRLLDDLPMWQSVVDTLNQTQPAAQPVCLIPSGQGLGRLADAIAEGTVPGLTSMRNCSRTAST